MQMVWQCERVLGEVGSPIATIVRRAMRCDCREVKLSWGLRHQGRQRSCGETLFLKSSPHVDLFIGQEATESSCEARESDTSREDGRLAYGWRDALHSN